MSDRGTGGHADRRFHGHSTQLAVAAAGAKSGVARRANLYMVKMSAAFLDGNGHLKGQTMSHPLALVDALFHINAVLWPGTMPSAPSPSKAVISITNTWEIQWLKDNWGHDRYDDLHQQMTFILRELDKKGVTIVISAGDFGLGIDRMDNNGMTQNDRTTHFADEFIPACLATVASPYILVGGVNSWGRPLPSSTPGRGACLISVYAPSEAIDTFDLTDLGQGRFSRKGNCFATSLVVSTLTQQLHCHYLVYNG